MSTLYRVTGSCESRESKICKNTRQILPKMPRGRKRKEEDSGSGRDKTAAREENEFPDKESPVKKRKEHDNSLTFKIEHWYV